MNLVRIALTRPYTFVVLAILILIVGPLAALRTPTDIFPEIRIPIIAVIWGYTGLPPDEMSGRVMLQFQRSLTTTVNNIERMEGTSYTGIGIVKIFFQPGTNMSIANAQVTSIAQTVLKQMPPGMTPPLVMNYNAATVPILQLALSAQGMTEPAVFDLAINTVRTPLITVPGAALPFPFGGKFRQIQIDLDAAAMQARGLSANDVANALVAQNILTPAGTQKIGTFEYAIQLNNAVRDYKDLSDLPIFSSKDGATVYLRDVAQVRDGNPPQQNIVHVDGQRSVVLQVLKNGATSTLSIVNGIKEKVEELRRSLPKNVDIALLNDQSLFVKAAIDGVVSEAGIAALLTSLMILLFLGSWRSTIIIATSIPLAILGAIALLSAFGETLNIMTLGGLALAVGILVDDATVTIENINYHLEQGKGVIAAITDGAQQIAIPAFVSTLCICIVFVPMFFMEGVPRFLFVPMALSVMFAMAWSYFLSRTLVPTMAAYLLKPHDRHAHGSAPTRNPLVSLQRAFERGFERLRASFRNLLEMALHHRAVFIAAFLGFIALSFLLVPFLGRNFFPDVDAGQILMHVRVPIGTRVEETASRFAGIEKEIRRIIPNREIATLVDNIGVPVSGINLTYNNTGTIGSQDGEIQIKLTPDHEPTAGYVAEMRRILPEKFPGVTFSFLPADIISQILNFGSPSPINIQVASSSSKEAFEHANRILARLRRVPGIVDARIQQARTAPVFDVDLDRSRAQYVGVTARDVTNSMVVNLAGSGQVQPTYWLNRDNGVTYNIVLQTPQYRLDSLASLSDMPIVAPGASAPQVLGGITDVKRDVASAVVTQFNLDPVVQVYAAVQGRDLGSVAADVRSIIKELAPQQSSKIRSVQLQGQVRTMDSAFSGLLFGLLGSVVLIYLLIVVNFQSWSDPFIIITALPAALAGIVWMLFVTHTTLSVPALTGAIMCMGVATANSVLVISFARERLAELGDATAAALEAGYVRCRPVIMTALAMVIGMLPMSLGLGEGGEQNAPLGRAVIGGLIFATITTLIFVPVVFSVIHRNYGKVRSGMSGSVGVPHAS